MARILLTRAQAAATLGVFPKQIDEYREKKGLPCSTLKFSDRRLYPEAAVKKWAKERGTRVYELKDPREFNCGLPSGAKCPKCGQRGVIQD